MSVHFSNILPTIWNWIAPPGLQDIVQLPKANIFDALMFAVTGQNHNFSTKPVTCQNMLFQFAQEVDNQWNIGASIILGSEEVDLVVDDQLNGPVVLGKVLSILPPGYEAFTTVVISYRAPRIENLLSLWKEIGVVETAGVLKKQSLYEFISDPATALQLHAFDPLRLVNTFLERGLKVKLIDLAGVEEAGINSYQLLACDLMEVPCDVNKNPVFITEKMKIRPDLQSVLSDAATVNVRAASTGELNVTNSQLEKIADQLQTYDCNFKNLTSHANLSVLYDHDFRNNMKKCSAFLHKPISRPDLWKNIMEIAGAHQ